LFKKKGADAVLTQVFPDLKTRLDEAPWRGERNENLVWWVGLGGCGDKRLNAL
jgi:hypothetical protein